MFQYWSLLGETFLILNINIPLNSCMELEMDPWLRALAALPKDLGLIASTYMAANRSQ